MNYHLKKFFILILYLHAIHIFGMEKPLPRSQVSRRAERKEQTKLLEISNHSEQFVHIITGSGIEVSRTQSLLHAITI